MSILLTGGGSARLPDLHSYTNAEAQAAVSRFGTAVSDDWKTAVDAFFGAIKSGAVSSSNILAKADVIVIPAHSASNWINVVQNAFNPSVGGGAPTFGSGGYATDGVDDWVSTFNPTLLGGVLSQDSAHYWCDFLAAASNSTSPFGWTTGTGLVSVNPRDSANDCVFRLHQANNSTFAGTFTGVNHILVNRTTSTATQLYMDSVARVPGTNPNQTSVAPNNAILRIGSPGASTFLACTVDAYGAGSTLTQNEVTDLYNALVTLKAATGHP